MTKLKIIGPNRLATEMRIVLTEHHNSNTFRFIWLGLTRQTQWYALAEHPRRNGSGVDSQRQ